MHEESERALEERVLAEETDLDLEVAGDRDEDEEVPIRCVRGGNDDSLWHVWRWSDEPPPTHQQVPPGDIAHVPNATAFGSSQLSAHSPSVIGHRSSVIGNRQSAVATFRATNGEPMAMDIEQVRAGFPALARKVNGTTAAYLDGPGGTQVHESVISEISGVMERGGANTHGPFVTSIETGAVVDEARAAVADLFGSDPDEVVFGQNMTSLTYAISRALACTWTSDANIVVTRLDHDANVATWLQAAESAGVEVRFVDFDPADGCSLDLTSLAASLDENTALVAFTHASNATGTITPVKSIVDMAHAVGALTYVDAVHYAPHGLIDVKNSGTDFLACSAYKWFGPHTGIMYGRRELLESVTPFKLRPSPNTSPDRWETGTQSFESLAGVTAAINYIASHGTGTTRRDRLIDAFATINAYEATISERFLSGLAEMPSVKLFGKTGSHERTPTFAIDIDGVEPDIVAERLGEQGIFVWSGNYYAYEVMGRLGKPDGLVRIGFIHYNTTEEVDRTLAAIQALT